MQQAGYHHANHLADQLRHDMDTRNSELFTLLQSVVDLQSQAPSVAPTTVSPITTPTLQANATTADAVQLEMLQLLKQMQQDMKASAPTPAPARRAKKTPDNATWPRRDTSKYCWTHGGCGHLGSGCKSKAPGHKDEATFDNRMGGSNAYCT